MSFDLAAWQRAATDLVAGAAYDGDDAALRALADSERLDVVREIVRSWRELRVRTSCPLTTALLDERGLFAQTVSDATRGGASAYREALALAFLDYVLDHLAGRFAGDGELLETARFEAEMIRRFHEY